ncbi:hypothetical protein [uncultured Rhodoblastus sp.]|uniref:hypothetical protein n=1 Tax=uncultured Rhodoblastus sp. TaxID=543037 RepID=UPI0025D22025|nr:hypothetical protein [uncultured Rhodoblastus sp.]
MVWQIGAIVGIEAVRRRDEWSSFLEAPDVARRRLACGGEGEPEHRHDTLGIAADGALRELPFVEAPGFSLDPRLHGEELARGGGLRAFGGDFVGIYIGDCETPDVTPLN